MNSLLKKLGGFSIGPIAGAFLGFITVPLITYFISADEFGRASMFTLAQSTISSVVYMGLDQAFVREYNQARLEKSEDTLIMNALFFPLLLGITVSLIIAAFPHVLSRMLFDVPGETALSYCLALMIPFCIFENFGLLKIRMEEKGALYSCLTICLKLFTLLFTVLLFLTYEKSFRSVILATVTAEILTSLMVFAFALRKVHFLSFKPDRELISRMLRFGIPIMPAVLIGWILTSMDKIMLRSMCSYAELGMYSAAFKIVNVLGIVQTCFTLFWPPVAYRWLESRKEEKYFSAVNASVSVIMVILCMMILLCKDIVAFILGRNFAGSIYIFPFIMLYPIMYTMSETTCLGINYSRRTGFNILVSAMSGAANIILNSLFIPLMGGRGAAVATGISYIVFFWGRTLISRRLWYKFPLGSYGVYTVLIVINCLLHTFCRGALPYIVSAISVAGLIPALVSALKNGKKLLETD